MDANFDGGTTNVSQQNNNSVERVPMKCSGCEKYRPARSTHGPPVQNAIVWNKTRGLDGIGDWSATDLCKDCCIGDKY